MASLTIKTKAVPVELPAKTARDPSAQNDLKSLLSEMKEMRQENKDSMLHHSNTILELKN